MNEFKVDTEALATAIKGYNDKINEMNSLKKNIDDCLNNLLADGWNSNAGEAFFKKFDSNWKEKVDKYLKFVEHLSDILQEAGNDFSDLVDYSNKLQYKN